MAEWDTPQYWDKKWSLKEQWLEEKVALDGSDGEEEFDEELLRRIAGKDVLDIGCGPGEFALRVARRARRVVCADVSTTALRLAKENLHRSKLMNVTFRLADASSLPFAENSFDVVYSRWGPASESIHTLSEAFRVLRLGGTFMEITIGERDKQNITNIFGRGQMYRVRTQVSSTKKMLLERVGFKSVVARDYLGTEVFETMQDLLVWLKSAPIVPSFEPRRDRKYLERVQKQCITERGIETPVHRVVLIGHK